MSRIIVAEFHKPSRGPLELFSLTVIEPCTLHGGGAGISRTTYDVDRSKKFGYIFHESGGGGALSPVPVSGIYYVRGDIAVKESPCQLVDGRDKAPYRSKRTKAIRKRNRTRRLRALPPTFRGQDDLLGWLEYNGIQEESVYCSKCKDSMPGNDYDLCKHCWWCERVGWYSRPSERCGCADRLICRGDVCDDCPSPGQCDAQGCRKASAAADAGYAETSL
jgi:hypothetical protein